MKKTFISLVLILFFAIQFNRTLATIGCEKGSGKIIQQDRELADFKTVSLELPGNIFLSQGDAESVKIETDDNILKLIYSKVYSDGLHIGTEKNICPTKLNIYVTMKDILGIEINGKGNITADKAIKSKKLVVNINGIGNLNFRQIDAGELQVVIEGQGNVEMAGKAVSCEAGVNGSGNINLLDLETSKCTAGIYGNGDIKVNVSDYLKADINGNGNIYYKSKPKKLETNINGEGQVIGMGK